MSSTEERLEFTLESSSDSESSCSYPRLYNAEVSSCCSYAVFALFSFTTCHMIIDHSLAGKTDLNTTSTLTPHDYSISVYSLFAIIIFGVISGYFTQLLRLPSLLGMLLVGIGLRNTPGLEGLLWVVKEWSVVLRRTAFIVILLRGGLSLDADAIRKLKGACLRLSFIPCSVEMLMVALSAKLIIGMDFLFGILLGAVLGAVSPAVVIPALLDASKEGYGVQAGVPSLVIAAASLDDVYAITIFSLALSFVYPSGSSLPMVILAAPAEVIAGVFFGAVAGVLFHVLPRKEVKNLHLIRLSLLFSFSTAIFFGTVRYGVDGAGPIAVLVSAFVASQSWKKEGHLPEEDHLANMWHLAFQPLLFGLIGFELRFYMVRCDAITCMLKFNTVLYGLLILCIGLSFRLLASILAVSGTSFNKRERVFVAIAWLPKATVQAALAPVVLDMVRSKSTVDPIYMDNGVYIFTIAVLSILITAPIGAFLIRVTTPLLLKKGETSEKEAENKDETDVDAQ